MAKPPLRTRAHTHTHMGFGCIRANTIALVEVIGRHTHTHTHTLMHTVPALLQLGPSQSSHIEAALVGTAVSFRPQTNVEHF